MEANVDAGEVGKFSRIASRWWDPEGEFKPLHQMNPVRANFIDLRADVAGKTVLDIGCGGGLLSEALALRGGRVTGIDLSADALDVARAHAQSQRLDIEYRLQSAEALAAERPGGFAVVTCLEVLEHVPDPAAFVATCASLVEPGGAMFFSTLNRTVKAYGMAVLGAEYILRMLPRGTHDYQKFIKPAELAGWARQAGLSLEALEGIVYNPITGRFKLDERDVDVNYIACFRRD